MGGFIDLTGKKFGRLTVLKRTGSGPAGQPLWKCRCRCGKTTTVRGHRLRKGETKSCGCFRLDSISARTTTHGDSKTSFYRLWGNMVARCTQPSSNSYPEYGALGIKVCRRWLKYENFKADMWPRPKGLQLDRIRSSGPYSPKNCRWVTVKEQQRNKRNCWAVQFQGRKVTLAELSEISGINRGTLELRLSKGMTAEEAATTPVRPHRAYRKRD